MSDSEATVGVLHRDPGTADRFRGWLDDSYEVWVATPPCETTIDRATDVVVVDWSLEPRNRQAIVEAVDGPARPAVLAVIDGVPDEDPSANGADDYLASPGSQRVLVSAVRTLALRREYRLVIERLSERAAREESGTGWNVDESAADTPAGFDRESSEIADLSRRADRLLSDLADEASYSHLFDRLFRE